MSFPRRSRNPFLEACSNRCRFASNGSGEEVGHGVAGRGIGAGVGVKVAEGDGVSVGALEGVALGAAGWRRQSNSSKIAAIAALSLQKSRKGRSEKRLIAGEAEYLQAPRSPQAKGLSAAQRNCSVVRTFRGPQTRWRVAYINKATVLVIKWR